MSLQIWQGKHNNDELKSLNFVKGTDFTLSQMPPIRRMIGDTDYVIMWPRTTAIFSWFY